MATPARQRSPRRVTATPDAAPRCENLLAAVELAPVLAVQAVWRTMAGARTAPLAVAEPGRGILAVCPHAAEAGMAPGQSAAQARLRCPELRLVSPQRDAEAALWAEMLLTLSTVSSRVEAADPVIGRAYLDAGGLEGVWGDGPAVARAALRALEGLDLSARAGMGPTRAVALALARRMDADGPRLLMGEPARTFLQTLPIGDPALQLPAEVTAALHELGVHTAGALAALPPDGLGLRFGPIALAAWRLVTLGEEPALRPWAAPEALEVMRQLEGGLSDAVLLARLLKNLSVDLAARLAERGQATTVLALALSCDDGTRHDASTRCWPPLSTAAALHTTTLALLERLRPTSPVETVLLRAIHLCRPQAQQDSLWPVQPWQDRRALLARTLAAQMQRYEHLRLRRLCPDPLSEEGWQAEELEPDG